jgi:hypothetical protein
MSGCGTPLVGHAIFEVSTNYTQIHEYGWWIRNYIAVQQGLAAGWFTPDQADWSDVTFYIKPGGSPFLNLVAMKREEVEGGKVRVSWTEWSTYDDAEVPYAPDGVPLTFTFNRKG